MQEANRKISLDLSFFLNAKEINVFTRITEEGFRKKNSTSEC